MLFDIILFAMCAALLAFYIALRVSPRLLSWFDNWLEPIRNYFYKRGGKK